MLEKDLIAKIRTALTGENVKALDESLSKVDKGVVLTGECKFEWIDELLSDTVKNKESGVSLGKFDRLITHHICQSVLFALRHRHGCLLHNVFRPTWSVYSQLAFSCPYQNVHIHTMLSNSVLFYVTEGVLPCH